MSPVITSTSTFPDSTMYTCRLPSVAATLSAHLVGPVVHFIDVAAALDPPVKHPFEQLSQLVLQVDPGHSHPLREVDVLKQVLQPFQLVRRPAAPLGAARRDRT